MQNKQMKRRDTFIMCQDAVSGQMDETILENNTLKIDKMGLEKEIERLTQQLMEKQTIMLQSDEGEMEIVLREKDKQIEKLETQISELENEKNFLTLENQFLKDEVKTFSMGDFIENNSISVDNNKELEQFDLIEELKDKCLRLEKMNNDKGQMLSKLKQERLMLLEKVKNSTTLNSFNNLNLIDFSAIRNSAAEPVHANIISKSEIKNIVSLINIEKKCSSIMRRSMIKTVTAVNELMNKEIQCNGDDIQGLQMTYKFEKLREKLIRVLNDRLAITTI